MCEFDAFISSVLFSYNIRSYYPLTIETLKKDIPWVFIYESIIDIYITLLKWIRKNGVYRKSIASIVFRYDHGLQMSDGVTRWDFDNYTLKKYLIPFLEKCLEKNFSLIID